MTKLDQFQEMQEANKVRVTPLRLVLRQREFRPQTQLPRKCSGHTSEPKIFSVKGTSAFRKKDIVFAGMTEAEVIAKAQAGDAECFEALYAMHKRRVFSLCLRMTGDHAQAEDLTQEAFLQLYRKIASFRGESAFSTWLHRLSTNIVLMQFRKRDIPETSLEQVPESQQEDQAAKEFGTRDNVLHGAIDRITLEKAMGELPPGYRMIFVLHDIEGYEHNEIAEILGCSIGNSKSQLHKARQKLRTFLRRTAEESLTSAQLNVKAESPVLAAA
jgi:RNA polymerase sigma-70 factor (ECF subfamily)